MYIKFTSRVSRLGSLLRPDIIVITDTHVIHNKRNANLITDTEESVPRDKIAGVKIHNKLVGSEITIYGYSANTFIRCEGFTEIEAKLIQVIINNAYAQCSNQELLDLYNFERDIAPLTDELLKRNLFIEDVFRFY
jgi:hypothetical protein